jgi:ATP-dependent 26S proteasome regulatory subunit
VTFEQQLDVYFRARFTLIVLVTVEEERALQAIKSVCQRNNRACLTWDLAEGFQPLSMEAGLTLPAARDPLTALEKVDQAEGNGLVVLKDFHECWGNPQVRRKLRSVAQRLKFTKKSLLVATPTGKLPEDLKDEAVVIDHPPPTAAELKGMLDQLTKAPGVKVLLTDSGQAKLLQAAAGLTAAQAQRLFAESIVSHGELDERAIAHVTRGLKQLVRESQALEFYDVTETVENVGGLGALKEWLRLREQAFTPEAHRYGLPAPKGLALIGIPGTGKSLTAKMIGGLWRVPLLRLDVGALFGSLVGETEERVRRALRLAEAVAPCVLWIDEVEKALASGGLDGGTSMRVFGAILTWMQEKRAACFVVATANDIQKLPPELIRKGRFDEIFFLDLPTLDERKEIFTVHLRKRQRQPGNFDIARLAQLAEGYVGAEIEQAVVDAMYVGFNARREFTTADVAAALGRQVPLSVSSRETIGALREWLREGRAQSASFREVREAQEHFVPVQLDLGKAQETPGAVAAELPGSVP